MIFSSHVALDWSALNSVERLTTRFQVSSYFNNFLLGTERRSSRVGGHNLSEFESADICVGVTHRPFDGGVLRDGGCINQCGEGFLQNDSGVCQADRPLQLGQADLALLFLTEACRPCPKKCRQHSIEFREPAHSI